jgi:hypothetical protein
VGCLDSLMRAAILSGFTLEMYHDSSKRRLTNLYSERPAWLDLVHRRLDEAVFAAYGWSPDISDDHLLAKLLELNLERAAAETA